MRVTSWILCTAGIGWTGVGCGGVGTPASHAQEAAQNIAENERFGRTELVLEKVAPGEKGEFIRTHAGWGGRITIADTELGSFRMTGTKDEDAEMNLRVTWYNAAEEELRSTLIRQKWHSQKGNWLLTSEERIDGDIGLLNEKVVMQAPEGPPARAQFPTIRIGGQVD
jgi:hypothetical protein